MSRKKSKALFNLLPALAVSILTIGSCSAILTSCKKDDPEPPTPPEPTEQVTLTFDAGEGTIVQTDEGIATLTVNSGTAWSEIKNTYSAYWDDDHPFNWWSLTQGGANIADTEIFTSDTSIYAVYDEHQHEFSSYTIHDDTTNDGATIWRVYGICSICSKEILLTDEQLQGLQGKVLVKENDKYRLSEDLAYEIQRAASTSIDIYLLYGTYYVYGNRTGSVVQAHLHGVYNSKLEMVSSLDCYNEDSIGEEKIWYAIGTELYCDNMILAGKTDATITWQGGIECNHMLCQYCLITGAHAAYCDTCTFLNCKFDSTNVTGGGNTDYSVFLYNRYATFHDCEFVSIGKAIKIYSHGTVINNSYEFLRCKFTITERVNPKPSINVDSAHQSDACKYQVYVYGCEQISGYTEEEPLYADEGGHTKFHDEPRPSQL